MFSIEEPKSSSARYSEKRMAYSELARAAGRLPARQSGGLHYLAAYYAACRAASRCIAPDSLAMGDSEKAGRHRSDRYGFLQHRRFVDGCSNNSSDEDIGLGWA